MVFNTNKEKGNSGLVAAIAYYGFKGYTISLPLNDTQDYDLIVDNGEKLLKVQVKATSQRTECGYSVVSVKSCGGTNGGIYKTVKDTNIDILFVLTELQEMYEIPFEYITTTSSLGLGPDRQCFRVDNLSTVYEKKIVQKEKEIKLCSKCGTEIGIKNTSGLCHSCAAAARRVVERPDKITLLKELQESNFTQVGKKYGVSDNAIRKWCAEVGLPTKASEIKNYKIEN